MIIGSYEHFDPDQSKGFRIWVSENMTYVTHMHRHLELLSMRKGRMLVTVNGQNHWLEEGDLCLVLSNRLHGYRTDDYSEVGMALFAPELVMPFIQRIKGQGMKRAFLRAGEVSEEMRAILQRIFDDEERDALLLGSYFHILLTRIVQATGLCSATNDASNAIVQQAISYIAMNMQKPILLPDVAQAVNVSHYHLSRLFKKQLGYSFPVYLMTMRIDYARALLIQDDRPISEVSAACGFESQRSFNRAFRLITGETPSHYRKNNLDKSLGLGAMEERQ